MPLNGKVSRNKLTRAKLGGARSPPRCAVRARPSYKKLLNAGYYGVDDLYLIEFKTRARSNSAAVASEPPPNFARVNLLGDTLPFKGIFHTSRFNRKRKSCRFFSLLVLLHSLNSCTCWLKLHSPFKICKHAHGLDEAA